ncbi:phage virion morphogenesis protein [Stomatohabitans albus]|uniref:phage virion morphogenesis protein n=1 Tax=Stomatohabitans albus TaxID=3110766 RepID=UPI00300C4F68
MRVDVDTPTLDQMVKSLANPEPALKDIQDAILEANKEAFDTQGASTGSPWQPLSAKWLKARKKQGKGTRILEYDSSRGGFLRKSLTHKTGYGAIRDIKGSSVTVGSSLVTAAHAQFGRPILRAGKRPVKVPVRPVTVLTAKLQAEFTSIIGKHLAAEKG